MIRYDLDFFQKYERLNIENNVSQEVVDIINNLAQLVGAPSYVKTPNFKEKNHSRNKKNKTDWALIRNFKVTKIEKKIEGIEHDMNVLREFLNKMTDKTYEENLREIILKVKTFDKKNLIIICKYIFEMASTNKFYSEMYANLYKTLMGEFEEMEEECFAQLEKFLKTFKEIIYIDPDEDYDGFCDMNEKNEKRRAMSQFFVNLMKNEVVDNKEIIKIILALHEQIFEFLKEKNNKNIVEEFVENIFIMLYNNKPFFKNSENWEKIEKDIEKITSAKKSDFPSLTNKIIFRYLDIAELNQ